MKINELRINPGQVVNCWSLVRKEGNPVIPKGKDAIYWVCYRSKHDHKLRVTDAVWFNCPEGHCDPEECELTTEDGDCYWPVGWHCAHSHPDYSNFYQAFDSGEVLAYAAYFKPEVPEALLNDGVIHE